MKKAIFLLFLSVMIFGLQSMSAKDQADQEMSVQVNTATADLKGVIIDKQTNETLAGVVVTANGQKVYTDLDGNFYLKNLCAGTCELKISMISYEDQIISINTEKTKHLKIQLIQR